jgi:(+)-pinoresinol hydroxylase
MTATASQTLGAEVAVIERGNQLYQYWCATCHGSGPGMLGPGTLPGTHALALRYKGALPPVLEDRTDLNDVLIKTVVRKGVVAMPFFRRTEISDADLDAIVAYLTRNSKKPG